MSWRVDWTARALKDLARLDREQQLRIVTAVEDLAAEKIADIKRLRDITPPEYRIRVGKWRVRFRFDNATSTIVILHVLRRDEAY